MSRNFAGSDSQIHGSQPCFAQFRSDGIPPVIGTQIGGCGS